jgi:penicillin V acylase-like amidase (Ntn superfamily)
MKIVIMFVVSLLLAINAFPCATFLLSNKDEVFVGHNLDYDISEFPCSIFINPSGLKKESFNWEEDIISKNGKDKKLSRIKWTSKFASLTVNPIGKDLPEGGINERGLFIASMYVSSGSQNHDEKVKFIPPLWIQFCLDSFETSNEVLVALEKVKPDISSFLLHYFITDATGNSFILEYDKTMNVYKKLQYPILCNTPYELETKRIGTYSGFGGKNVFKPIERNFDERFIQIAYSIKEMKEKEKKYAVEDAFVILKSVSYNITQLSIVYDINNRKIYFKSRNTDRIKEISLNDVDLKKINTPLYIDTDIKHEGNVVPYFKKLDNSKETELIGALKLYPFQSYDGILFSEEYKRSIAKRMSSLMNN